MFKRKRRFQKVLLNIPLYLKFPSIIRKKSRKTGREWWGEKGGRGWGKFKREVEERRMVREERGKRKKKMQLIISDIWSDKLIISDIWSDKQTNRDYNLIYRDMI